MKSNYQGVKYIANPKSVKSKRWEARMMHNGVIKTTTHYEEKEAAKAYDMMLIRIGKEPVNVLKRKL